ncbi:MAG: hypothetical protein PVI75_00590 [Gammaproteobacteria bacterium]|jgi:hypothetical protein
MCFSKESKSTKTRKRKLSNLYPNNNPRPENLLVKKRKIKNNPLLPLSQDFKNKSKNENKTTFTMRIRGKEKPKNNKEFITFLKDLRKEIQEMPLSQRQKDEWSSQENKNYAITTLNDIIRFIDKSYRELFPKILCVLVLNVRSHLRESFANNNSKIFNNKTYVRYKTDYPWCKFLLRGWDNLANGKYKNRFLRKSIKSIDCSGVKLDLGSSSKLKRVKQTLLFDLKSPKESELKNINSNHSKKKEVPPQHQNNPPDNYDDFNFNQQNVISDIFFPSNIDEVFPNPQDSLTYDDIYPSYMSEFF